MNVMTYYVYALIDPTNMIIRYVGSTECPGERYRCHLSNLKKPTNFKKAIWIQDLRAINLKPIMVVLKTCNHFDKIVYENYYYDVFSAKNELYQKRPNAKSLDPNDYRTDLQRNEWKKNLDKFLKKHPFMLKQMSNRRVKTVYFD